MTPGRGRIIACCAGAGVLAILVTTAAHWREIANAYWESRMKGEWKTVDDPFEFNSGYGLQRGQLRLPSGDRIPLYFFNGLKISNHGIVTLTYWRPSMDGVTELKHEASYRISGNRFLLENLDWSEALDYPFDFAELEYRFRLEGGDILVFEADWGSIRYSRVEDPASAVDSGRFRTDNQESTPAGAEWRAARRVP